MVYAEQKGMTITEAVNEAIGKGLTGVQEQSGVTYGSFCAFTALKGDGQKC